MAVVPIVSPLPLTARRDLGGESVPPYMFGNQSLALNTFQAAQNCLISTQRLVCSVFFAGAGSRLGEVIAKRRGPLLPKADQTK